MIGRLVRVALRFPLDRPGAQASQFSSSESVKFKFALNSQVVRRDGWEEARKERSYLGSRPKPNTIAGALVWHARIGKLMPAGEDRWWVIRPSDDIDLTFRACGARLAAPI